MRPLRHRRALLGAIDQLNNEEAAGTPQAAQIAGTFSSIPEFGRILTHLSNVRTVHSWSRLAVQQLILALGVVRLGVIEEGDEQRVLYRLVVGICAAWCVVGVGFAVYGGCRFLRVTKILDSAETATSKCVGGGVDDGWSSGGVREGTGGAEGGGRSWWPSLAWRMASETQRVVLAAWGGRLWKSMHEWCRMIVQLATDASAVHVLAMWLLVVARVLPLPIVNCAVRVPLPLGLTTCVV